MTEQTEDRLLTPGEVARMLRVNVRTVARWTELGILTAIRPLATGHRRYRESQVRELLTPKDN